MVITFSCYECKKPVSKHADGFKCDELKNLCFDCPHCSIHYDFAMWLTLENKNYGLKRTQSGGEPRKNHDAV